MYLTTVVPVGLKQAF